MHVLFLNTDVLDTLDENNSNFHISANNLTYIMQKTEANVVLVGIGTTKGEKKLKELGLTNKVILHVRGSNTAKAESINGILKNKDLNISRYAILESKQSKLKGVVDRHYFSLHPRRGLENGLSYSIMSELGVNVS